MAVQRLIAGSRLHGLHHVGDMGDNDRIRESFVILIRTLILPPHKSDFPGGGAIVASLVLCMHLFEHGGDVLLNRCDLFSGYYFGSGVCRE